MTNGCKTASPGEGEAVGSVAATLGGSSRCLCAFVWVLSCYLPLVTSMAGSGMDVGLRMMVSAARRASASAGVMAPRLTATSTARRASWPRRWFCSTLLQAGRVRRQRATMKRFMAG